MNNKNLVELIVGVILCVCKISAMDVKDNDVKNDSDIAFLYVNESSKIIDMKTFIDLNPKAWKLSVKNESSEKGKVHKKRKVKKKAPKQVLLLNCKYCEFSSCGFRTLIGHIKKIHPGEKPYLCCWPGCNYAANRSCNLSKHKKAYHLTKKKRKRKKY